MTAHAMAGDREKSLDAGMNGHLNKPVDPVALYQILQQFIPKNGHIRPPDTTKHEKTTPCCPTKTSNGVPLPPLQGIDQAKALESLNNNPDMLLSILNDFKQDYGNHPKMVTELLNQEQFKEIRIIAHTVKGICGYMGANALFNCAEKLENHLRTVEGEIQKASDDAPLRHGSEKTYPFSPSPLMESGPGGEIKEQNIENGDQEHINLVHLFIDEMERILEGLDGLPPCQNRAADEKSDIQSGMDCGDHLKQASALLPQEEQRKEADDQPLSNREKAHGQISSSPRHHALQTVTEKEQELLLRFMNNLKKGEVTAVDLLPKVRHVFRKWGRENMLETIQALMDDIEYEAAAMEVQRFLTALRTSHGR